VTRYFKSRAADTAFIATESNPSGWTAATHALDCYSVFTNPARTCHHADPRVQLFIKDKARVAVKVYVIKGTAKDAWAVVEKRETIGKA